MPRERSRSLKELQAALAASERRYRELFDEDTSGRLVATPDGVLLDSNARLAQMLGYESATQFIGRNMLDLAADVAVLQKLLTVTKASERAGPADLQLVRADGTRIDVRASLAATMTGEGQVESVRGTLTENTATRELETRLRGAERMEAIGRLAGGLAHDFNNLLMVIAGNTERLLDEMEDASPHKNAANSIRDAAARATTLTRQLLAYGRRQVFELEPLDLQRLVIGARPTLQEILGSRIRLSITAAPDVPSISADARQIEHVLANLAVNAAEAMPSGGTLTIAVDTLEVGEHAPQDRLWLRPGRYARLTVTDSGHGMDAVTRAYAFQPFFTTKRMGDGRGLGLATVYGIVKQSHGFVWLDSEPEKGATFTLLFPALRTGRTAAGPGDLAAATETVLIVEGDASARQYACEALRRRGYHVLDADSGTEALRVFASHPGRIHLLVSDLSATPADGVPLADRLKAIDPMLQSLVVLDHAESSARGPRVLPATPAIYRPFTLRALAEKVRDVLDSGEGR